MLVLSRKTGQQIQIGPDISITIVKVGQGGVRLGIDAPAELAVLRTELTGRNELTTQDEQPDGPAAASAAVFEADSGTPHARDERKG